MNGISSIFANLCPFVLSLSKDSERVFQHPATAFLLKIQNLQQTFGSRPPGSLLCPLLTQDCVVVGE